MAILDAISTKLTDFVTDDSTDIQEKETIEYGIYMFFSESTKILTVMTLAVLAGKLKDTLIIIGALGILRNYMGGVHAKTHLGCFLSYTAALIFIFASSNYLDGNLARTIILGLLPFVIWAVRKYAPADTEFKPILSQSQTRKYRMYSFGLTVLFYILVFVLPEPFNFYLGFSVIAEVLLILPITYKLYKIKYGKEVPL